SRPLCIERDQRISGNQHGLLDQRWWILRDNHAECINITQQWLQPNNRSKPKQGYAVPRRNSQCGADGYNNRDHLAWKLYSNNSRSQWESLPFYHTFPARTVEASGEPHFLQSKAKSRYFTVQELPKVVINSGLDKKLA